MPAALAEKLALCQYFYVEVQQIPGIEVGPPPELSVCYFRYLPENEDANDVNQKLLQYIHQDGRVFMSSTTLDGKFLIRVAVLSFRTHLATIDLALVVIRSGISHITKSGQAATSP